MTQQEIRRDNSMPFDIEMAKAGDLVEHHYTDSNGRLWVTPVELEFQDDYIYCCEA